MENSGNKDKIKCRMKEIVALSNIKEEIVAEDLKKRKMYNIVLPTCAIFILGGCILTNNYKSSIVKKAENNEMIEYSQNNNMVQKENINISQVLTNIDDEKVFYEKTKTSEELSFEYEPTIENLYKNADIVVIGTYNSDEKMYKDGTNIYTKTKFDVSKIIKNTTKFDVSKEVVFDRQGGVLTLDEYLKNNMAIKKGEFKDIKEEDRKDYYIIQEYGQENILDFTKEKDNLNKYIIFLNYIEEEDKLMLNSTYYGIREIKENKVYDYDISGFTQIENKDIYQAIN